MTLWQFENLKVYKKYSQNHTYGWKFLAHLERKYGLCESFTSFFVPFLRLRFFVLATHCFFQSRFKLFPRWAAKTKAKQSRIRWHLEPPLSETLPPNSFLLSRPSQGGENWPGKKTSWNLQHRNTDWTHLKAIQIHQRMKEAKNRKLKKARRIIFLKTIT